MKTTTKPISKRERIEEIYSDVRYFKSLGLTRPAKECFDRFADILEKEWRGRFPEPYIYPDVLGGISVEWYLYNTEITLEVNLKTLQAYYYALNFTTDAEDSRTLDLSTYEAWDWLRRAIKSIQKGN